MLPQRDIERRLNPFLELPAATTWHWTPQSGGCINETFLAVAPVSPETNRAFIKINDAGFLSAFEAEAEGLEEILATECVKAPRPWFTGGSDDRSFLAMEAHFLNPEKSDPVRLGRELARLHTHTQENFGWHRHNVIGRTFQDNSLESDWVTFFRERRLRCQMEHAASKGLRLVDADLLLDQLGAFFLTHRPGASLLHGDLWAGNAAYDETGRPVLFDPAVYYGDRECDLAFTTMFGRFPDAFYQAYETSAPLDPGFEKRRPLYNLYHLLNHYNLFGGSYGPEAISEVRNLLNAIP